MTVLIHGKYVETHFCDACAANCKELDVTPLGNGVRCTFCGMSIAEIKKRGRFGCAKDYELFANEVETVLESYHGRKKHVGKIPSTEKVSA